MKKIKRNINVNFKVSEMEKRRLDGKLKETGLTQSDFFRICINSDDKIYIRYDGDKLMKGVYQVEERISNMVHQNLDKCDYMEKKINKYLSTPCLPPFRIMLSKMSADVVEMKKHILQEKVNADEEIMNNVRI